MRTPVVAIIGRPNVGKSTFFNQVLGYKKAIVEDIAGVTRDRQYAFIERYAVPFYLVDTGGFEKNPSEELAALVVEQTLLAIDEADAIVALFDGTVGLQNGDYDVVDLLRKQGKPVVYAVNKCDGVEQVTKVADFYSLGLSEIHDISAMYGRGTRALVDTVLQAIPDYTELQAAASAAREKRFQAEQEAEVEYAKFRGEEAPVVDQEAEEEAEAAAAEEPAPVVEREPMFAPVFVPGESAEEDAEDYDREYRVAPLPEYEAAGEEDEAEETEKPIEVAHIDTIRLAIVGRPNVGKSTLLNSFAGETRAITSSIAGTTRDTLDITINRNGQDFVLTDTAGIRKQPRVTEKLEKYSVMRALKAISDCDVAAVLIDASTGPTDQDEKIAGIVHEEGRGLVLVVNKWDLIEKDHRTAHEFKRRMKEVFRFAPYAPVVFTSAISGRRGARVLVAAKQAAYNRCRRIPTGLLNRTLRKNLRRVSPPSYRGRAVKLFFANQIEVAPPRFLLFFNQPKGVHFSYLRFIKNVIRERFGFEGTDVKLETRKRGGEKD